MNTKLYIYIYLEHILISELNIINIIIKIIYIYISCIYLILSLLVLLLSITITIIYYYYLIYLKKIESIYLFKKKIYNMK